jgi:serine/threonine protein kinase
MLQRDAGPCYLRRVGDANDLAHEAEARVGTVLLGKWRIERLLGTGGMGAVYEVEHRNESRAAVKILHPGAALSKAQLARFKREGYAANHVGHPGVVEVLDDDIDEQGSPFLVMELLEGKTVAELAKDQGGKLPVDAVLKLVDELLDVLAAAHAKGILHRDIKPTNLFVTTAGNLKVLDFGIARLAEREAGGFSTIDGTVLGTPEFSSPEQARGRVGEMDERSDVWAVGATTFTLLTGQLVHPAEMTNERLGLAMSVDAPSLASVDDHLPRALVDLVDRALAYEQRDRWPSARAMQDAVRSVRAALAKGLTEGHRPRLRRRGLLAAAIATIAVITSIGALRSEHGTKAMPRSDRGEALAEAPHPSAWLTTGARTPPQAEPVHASAVIDVAPQHAVVSPRATPSTHSRAAALPSVLPVVVATPEPSTQRGPYDRRH